MIIQELRIAIVKRIKELLLCLWIAEVYCLVVTIRIQKEKAQTHYALVRTRGIRC
jgi:hypothetical protein